MKKAIDFGNSALEKIMRGAKKINDAVKVTLGASGRNVIISRSVIADYGLHYAPVHSTKDGITVANNVEMVDPEENIGVMLLREASQRTADQAGDGTTTTILMAYEMAVKGLEMVKTGVNPVDLKRSLDVAVEIFIKSLRVRSTDVRYLLEQGDVSVIEKVAMVSSNHDPEIGKLIAHAYKSIGADGEIDIQESKTSITEITIMDGFTVNRGFLHRSFIADFAKMETKLENPFVLIYDKAITSYKEIEPIIVKACVTEKRSLLIICEDMDGEALAFLGMNTQSKIIKCCVIKSPGHGDFKQDFMEDIALVTGATIISDLKGIGLKSAGLQHLGSAKKVIVNKDKSTIFGGNRKDDAYQTMISDLQLRKAAMELEQERDVISKRLARLQSVVAIIYVGAYTETEMKEKLDRCDDAVRATKAAIAEGYVIGGGTTFIRIKNLIESGQYKSYKLGFDLLYHAVDAPLRSMLWNSGITKEEDIKAIFGTLDVEGTDVGFNTKTQAFENFHETGIIDPTKVLRCSLQNAASVAGTLFTTECIISDAF